MHHKSRDQPLGFWRTTNNTINPSAVSPQRHRITTIHLEWKQMDATSSGTLHPTLCSTGNTLHIWRPLQVLTIVNHHRPCRLSIHRTTFSADQDKQPGCQPPPLPQHRLHTWGHIIISVASIRPCRRMQLEDSHTSAQVHTTLGTRNLLQHPKIWPFRL